MNENWFIEIASLQKRQDDIDRRETEAVTHYSTDTSLSGQATAPIVTARKNVGRPPTKWNLINEVLRIYDISVEAEINKTGKRLSLRAIQKILNRRVKYLTIRKILKTYRGDIYPNKKID